MRISDWSSDVCSSDLCPILNCDPGIRYPVLGASLQRRGGVARHDAVAWGYARGADSRGVDIIQNCEVTGIRRDGNRVAGVETTRGFRTEARSVGKKCGRPWMSPWSHDKYKKTKQQYHRHTAQRTHNKPPHPPQK